MAMTTRPASIRRAGWWGPVAVAVGVDPAEGVRRLARGVAATLAAALCVFSLLTGAGSWIARSPTPSWWPLGSGPWIAALLAVGAVLVPVWWKLGFARDEASVDPARSGGS